MTTINFKDFAKNEKDSPEVSFRRILILFVALSCCFCGFIWGLLYYSIFGKGIITYLPFSFVAIVGSTIIISHLLRNYKVLVYAQLICITWIPMFIQWSIGSIDRSGFVTAWSFLGPLGALIFLKLRQSVLWMIMFIIIVSVIFEPSLLGEKAEVTHNTRILFYIMNIVMASSVVFVTMAWFARIIQIEKGRSDDLLLNILPTEVAEELKSKGQADARLMDEVTVLFTDFRAFTEISEKLTAKELVSEINEYFSSFDVIMDKYGIEKIKTIGDSYMAAGGLPSPNKTHPEDVVNAALEIQKYVLKHKVERESQGKPYFEVRIGIHSGPVVAGIVGIKKFQYDIWGDTVNTASRMESSGEAGKVNISGTTYELVRDKFTCIHRGKIKAKGKGEVDMYFVER